MKAKKATVSTRNSQKRLARLNSPVPDHPDRSPLHRIAIHEAGHATACLIRFIPLDYVTIIRDGKVGGHTAAYMPVARNGADIEEWRLHLKNAILASCSGAAAEELVYGNCYIDNCTDDFVRAEKYLQLLIKASGKKITESGKTEIIKTYGRVAYLDMKKYRRLLTAIAQRLLKQRMLPLLELVILKMKYVKAKPTKVDSMWPGP